jgi:hypothetical protein
VRRFCQRTGNGRSAQFMGSRRLRPAALTLLLR